MYQLPLFDILSQVFLADPDSVTEEERTCGTE